MNAPQVGQKIQIHSDEDVFEEECIESSPDFSEHNTGWNFSVLTKRQYTRLPRKEYLFSDATGGHSHGYVKSIQRTENNPDVSRVIFYLLVANP
jgi:hypothetical protein